MRSATLLSLLAVLFSSVLCAQGGGADPSSKPPAAAGDTPTRAETAPQDPTPTPTSLKDQLAEYHPVEGVAKVGSWAEVRLPSGWLWLGSRDARKFLTQMGNPDDPSVLGLAVPPDFSDSGMFAVCTYDDEGHVDDGDVPDYDDLLVQMKADTDEGSKERRKAGMAGVQLLGWAEPPHYDRATKKLYWAKRLKFDDNDGETLNYNVRVFGRAGTLEITGVGGIEQLAEVAAHCKTLLDVTEFVAGQRYTDFDPSVDAVVAGGIGAVIAGKLALKAGLFAKLLVFLKVAIKPILIGLVVLGGVLVKVFRGRKQADSAPLVDGTKSAS